MKNELTQEKQVSLILLNILMGEDPLKEIKIDLSDVSIGASNMTLPEFMDAANKFRPDLLGIDKMIESQKIEVSREKSTLFPRLDLFGEARNDTNSFSEDGGQNYIVGVKAKMDFFDPSHSSRVKMSKDTLKKLEYDKDILKDSIAQGISSEFARYKSGSENLSVVDEMLNDSRQAVELMLPLYREGRKSIADLLEIRFAYLYSANEYYMLSSNLRSSLTKLLYLSGQLNQDMKEGE
jgi:outer membrane protein TolC